MSTLRRWLLRIWTTCRSGKAARELARETAAHLALLEDDYRSQGLSPEAARLGGAPRLRALALFGLLHAPGGRPLVSGLDDAVRRPINDVLVEIIGVAPAGYTGLTFDWHPHPELYLPLQTYQRVAKSNKLERTDPSFGLWGRLKPDVTRGQAEAQLGLVASQLDAPFDEMYFAEGAVTVVPFGQSPVRPAPAAKLLRLRGLPVRIRALRPRRSSSRTLDRFCRTTS